MSESKFEPIAEPTEKVLVLRVIPMPADCNSSGDIFGGWVMSQVDLAGAILPSQVAKGRVVTVSVNEFIFKEPVKVGDVLSFFAQIKRVGKTSITVDVDVYSQRIHDTAMQVKVTQATLTYVAVDTQGKPRAIPV